MVAKYISAVCSESSQVRIRFREVIPIDAKCLEQFESWNELSKIDTRVRIQLTSKG